TFINPTQDGRTAKVKIKFNPVREVLEGKRVVVVDDSLVRGTTSKGLVQMIRAAGAREVHFRVASPPITGPCYYGIDTPTKSELIASSHSIEEIRRHLGVETLGYLSLQGMLRAASGDPSGFCHACFSGQYPTPIPQQTARRPTPPPRGARPRLPPPPDRPPSLPKKVSSPFWDGAEPMARPRCGTSSAARGRASPRWRISACRSPPASPSPPSSASATPPTARSPTNCAKKWGATSSDSSRRRKRSSGTAPIRCSCRCAPAPRCPCPG